MREFARGGLTPPMLLECRAANPGSAQCDFYGTEHLLRLVAKLPSLLQDAKMSPETGKQVLSPTPPLAMKRFCAPRLALPLEQLTQTDVCTRPRRPQIRPRFRCCCGILCGMRF